MTTFMNLETKGTYEQLELVMDALTQSDLIETVDSYFDIDRQHGSFLIGIED